MLHYLTPTQYIATCYQKFDDIIRGFNYEMHHRQNNGHPYSQNPAMNQSIHAKILILIRLPESKIINATIKSLLLNGGSNCIQHWIKSSIKCIRVLLQIEISCDIIWNKVYRG